MGNCVFRVFGAEDVRNGMDECGIRSGDFPRSNALRPVFNPRGPVDLDKSQIWILCEVGGDGLNWRGKNDAVAPWCLLLDLLDVT